MASSSQVLIGGGIVAVAALARPALLPWTRRRAPGSRTGTLRASRISDCVGLSRANMDTPDQELT